MNYFVRNVGTRVSRTGSDVARRKQISERDITGEKGIALIHRRVLDMGFLWHPTNLEAGIDGFIEIRDPVTGVVSNCIVQVQSKAGPSWFKAEKADSFSFACDERDLDYWLAGNAPVILVVSRPDADEAYWVCVNEYFADPQRRKTRKILFSKTSDQFDVSCRERLASLAIPRASGIFLPALPLQETLTCNLLPLTSYPKRLFRASTQFRFARQVIDTLEKTGPRFGRDWLLHGEHLYAFEDLTFPAWEMVCDARTTQNLSTVEWAFSGDRQQRYVFVRLMKVCLTELLYRQWVRYHSIKKQYYFRSTPDMKERKVGGLSVFKGYTSKTTPDRIAYYRHRAMMASFVLFEKQWYIEVTPSYHFTQDGFKLSRYFEERLSGIKLVERQNQGHLRQLRLWAEVLQQFHLRAPTASRVRQPGLFDATEPLPAPITTEPYTVITFGPPLEFTVDCGVPDAAWLPSEPAIQDVDGQRRLFE